MYKNLTSTWWESTICETIFSCPSKIAFSRTQVTSIIFFTIWPLVLAVEWCESYWDGNEIIYIWLKLSLKCLYIDCYFFRINIFWNIVRFRKTHLNRKANNLKSIIQSRHNYLNSSLFRRLLFPDWNTFKYHINSLLLAKFAIINCCKQ